jgi:hypothetical protein
MSDTFFQNGTIITASWLNDLNKLNYSIFGNPTSISQIDHNSFGNTGSLSHTVLDAHVADSDIHFDDAPADGNTYGRRDNAWIIGSGGGTDDHSLLNNLAADDHNQYHNDVRGDARYLQKIGTNGGSQMSGPLHALNDVQLRHNNSPEINLYTYTDGVIVGNNLNNGNLTANNGLQVQDTTAIEQDDFNPGDTNYQYGLAVNNGDIYADRHVNITNNVLAEGAVIGSTGIYSEGFTIGDTLIWGTVKHLGFSGASSTTRSGFVSSVTKISNGTYRLNLSSAVTTESAVIIVGNWSTFGGTGACVYESGTGTNSQLYINCYDSSGNLINADVDFQCIVINTDTQAP